MSTFSIGHGKGRRTNNRRFPHERGPAPHNAQARRDSAAARHEARLRRTPEDQLSVLDRRLGKGKGALNERTRLLAELERID